MTTTDLSELETLIRTDIANNTDTVITKAFAAYSGFDIKCALDDLHETTALLVLCPVLDTIDQFTWALGPFLDCAREEPELTHYLVLDHYDRMAPAILDALRSAVDKSAEQALLPANVHVIWHPSHP